MGNLLLYDLERIPTLHPSAESFPMRTLKVKNYRAFGKDSQTARLAPLTLLVGENSTGKTSFMALIRAVADVAYADVAPDFKQPPYELGSFANIVHNHGDGGGVSGGFDASFTLPIKPRDGSTRREGDGNTVTFSVRFEELDGEPYPTYRRFAANGTWIEEQTGSQDHQFIVKYRLRDASGPETVNFFFDGGGRVLFPFHRLPSFLNNFYDVPSASADVLRDLLRDLPNAGPRGYGDERRPYASSPIRSRPQRTYDPGAPKRDPEGEHALALLARMSMSGGTEWESLKKAFRLFGHASGLFDAIEFRQLGDSDDGPFQLLVRSGTASERSPFRNLADVGYGVSQILPILTELLQPNAARMSLLQQPEIHLHPSAQAAIGTLFCSLAASGKQLIVETHSDHLIDRVRMSVRDGVSGIKAEDVSILYFERNDLDVKIHSISIDRQGNIIGAPEDYRRFFMEEVERSIGIRTIGSGS